MKKWLNWSLLVCLHIIISTSLVHAVPPTMPTGERHPSLWAIRTLNIQEWQEAVLVVREKISRGESVQFPYEFSYVPGGQWRFAIDYDFDTQTYMEVTSKAGMVIRRTPHFNSLAEIPETDETLGTDGNKTD